jgi:hypothetical protein
MKIIKMFEDKEFAKNRSDTVCFQTGKAEWYWGLGDDDLLYAKGSVTGYIYSNWFPFRDICMGGLLLSEIVRIYENFIGTETKQCTCDIMVLMAKGCQCGSCTK